MGLPKIIVNMGSRYKRIFLSAKRDKLVVESDQKRCETQIHIIPLGCGGAGEERAKEKGEIGAVYRGPKMGHDLPAGRWHGHGADIGRCPRGIT